MLKKTKISFNNNYGVVESSTLNLDKPIVLGIVPGGNTRNLNGYMNTFMYLLQIRKSPNVNSDYDISNIPFNILIAQKNDEIDKLIINSIPSNNFTLAKKIFRNINIISYCAGNFDTSRNLKNIYDALINKGYTENEAIDILRQIFVLQIVDNYVENKHITKIPYATVVTVHDIYDLENYSYRLEEEKKSKFIHNPFVRIIKNVQNDRYVLYKSFGEGSLSQSQNEHMFDYDYIHAPILNSLMGIYLIKALSMSLNKTYIKDNLSITSEFNYILAKVQQFVMQKDKDFNSFTKEELGELDIYLMNEIRRMFKEYISIKTLSTEEQDYLNEKEDTIRNVYKIANFNYELSNIINAYKSIINLFDNYSDNDIVETRHTNNGVINLTKSEAIQEKIQSFTKRVNHLYELLNSINLEGSISSKVQSDLNNWISEILSKIISLINDNKMREIFNKYSSKDNIKMSI